MTEHIPDKELKAAAAALREAMLAALPEPEDCPADFTPEFEEKIEALQKTHARKTVRRQTMRRLVAAVLAVVIALSALVLSNPQARAAVFSWVRKVFGYRTTYILPEKEHMELPMYVPQWLPEGFEVVFSNEMEHSKITAYFNPDQGYGGFSFAYEVATGEARVTADTSGGDYTQEIVSINGMYGELFVEKNGAAGNMLIWIDEPRQVILTLDGILSPQDMMHIAQNVKLSDSTN